MGDMVMRDAVPVSDPGRIVNAFPGWGALERFAISIVGRGDPEEMNRLRQEFAEAHGGDISKALDSEALGGFETLVVFCLLDPAERDAYLANRAILKGDNYVLVEIACTRSSQQLLLVKEAYHALYKKSLEEDVAQARAGICRELLLPLIGAYRYSGPEVEMNLAKAEALKLYKKISEKDYNNNDVIWFFSTSSKALVKATLDYYRYAFGNDISTDLEADPNDEFLHILRTAVECLTSPEKYFGKVLKVAINAQIRDERAMARVLSTRADVDVDLIIGEYRRLNGPYFLPQLQELVALVRPRIG